MDPDIWELIWTFGIGSGHLGTDPDIWELIWTFENRSGNLRMDLNI
jgi:hypothetical protein